MSTVSGASHAHRNTSAMHRDGPSQGGASQNHPGPQSPGPHPAGNMTHTNNINSGYPQLSRKFVARRISEGETGRLKEELKCQACGKGYKHVSSLAKHLWEHTPEWSVTSKLLISKHQQVQLLEAASILVSMNENEEEEEDEDEEDEETPSNTEHESSHEPLSDPLTADSSVHSSVEPEMHAKEINAIDTVKEETVQDFLQEQLTPARDIPITSGKPVFKTPSKSSHHAHHGIHPRRLSTTHYSAASSLGSSLGRHRDSFLRQASPLPEAVLAKDFAHYPPNRGRSHSALHASNISLHASRPSRDFAIEDEDGLQDPHEDDDAKSKLKDTHGDVFGNLEV